MGRDHGNIWEGERDMNKQTRQVIIAGRGRRGGLYEREDKSDI